MGINLRRREGGREGERVRERKKEGVGRERERERVRVCLRETVLK